jgi:hypothetical protein
MVGEKSPPALFQFKTLCLRAFHVDSPADAAEPELPDPKPSTQSSSREKRLNVELAGLLGTLTRPPRNPPDNKFKKRPPHSTDQITPGRNMDMTAAVIVGIGTDNRRIRCAGKNRQIGMREAGE